MTVENDRINGWREIAAYLGRDERTAKRWEKQRGLPVRRVPGDGRANVYVLRSEVDAWLLGRPWQGLETGSAGRVEDVAGSDGSAAGRAGTEAEAAPGTAAETCTPNPITANDEPADDEAAIAATSLRATFRPREHVSLMVSLFGLLVLLTASAMRFFQVGPLEKILFASEGARPAVVNPERDELYLRGMYLCEARSMASLEEAKELFPQAIARDGGFAPGYVGLATTYLLLREDGTMPEGEAYDRAREAAERAMELEPRSAEAHAVLGFVDFFWLRKAPDAEHEFGLAMQMDERSALAHHWYGSMLMHQARYDEAVAQLTVAQRLNPASTAILASKALAMGFGGDRDGGVRLLEGITATGQDAPVVHRNLAYLSLIAPRDPQRYVEEAERFAAMRRDEANVELLRNAAETLSGEGESAMWRSIAREERRTHPDAAHPTYLMAEAEAMQGHESTAMRDLEGLATDRDGRMMGMLLEPAFLPLHKDAEFTRIAQEIGLLYPAVATR